MGWSLRFLGVGNAGAVTSSKVFRLSVVALPAAALIWRLACAVAWRRANAAIRFASLSHMLINGFFFSQGFCISGSSAVVTRPRLAMKSGALCTLALTKNGGI